MDIRTAVSRIDYYTQSILESAKNSDNGKDYIWVIVESDDDCEVYGKFLEEDGAVRLRDSGCKEYSGDVAVIRKGWKRVETLVKGYSNILTIIGIRDKDYKKYQKGWSAVPFVFETDCRDIEMMMIQAGVLERFIPSDLQGRQLTEILTSVYEHTREIGYMRIMNEVCQLSCRFHDMNMSLVWDQNSHEYWADWLDNLVSRFINLCQKPVTEQQLNDFVVENQLDNESVYDVCRGHDVIAHLSWNLVDKQYSISSLSSQLKEKYNLADFQKTNLCRDLKQWEVQANRTLLKTA